MLLLMPFLLLIRLTGRKITFFEHNVVTKFDQVATHFNLAPDSLKLKIYNYGIVCYYRLLGLLVDRVVVMNEALKKRIEQFIDPGKIICFPFWIKQKKYKLNYQESRAKLKIAKNEFLLISFGFVTWYKGADWIIDQVRRLNRSRKLSEKIRELRLILVGGSAYSLKDREYYQDYLNEQLEKTDGRIRITGFVPESQVGLYFTAADLVVFPYRGFFGASGALNYALSYEKPFLLSSHLAEMTHSGDFNSAIESAGLTAKDILFNLTSKSFSMKLLKVHNREFIVKLKLLSKLLSQKRTIHDLLPKFNQEIYNITDETPNRKFIAPFYPAKAFSR